jgi:hypothetical protein
MKTGIKYFTNGLLVISLLLSHQLALAAGKKALVIGNATYSQEAALVNTLNDAKDIAKKLKQMGFSVTLLPNLKKETMRKQVNRFLWDIENSEDPALIFYSGHGIQDRNRSSYLLPVDAEIKHQADIASEGISVNGILDKLKDRPKNAISLLILDACRNNPFASKRGGKGLSRVTPSSGTLVLYAASPDQTAEDNPQGRNGLFTKHLLSVMDRPGLDIEDAFEETAIAVRSASNWEQIPYKEGNLLGKYYLVEKKRVKLDPSPAADKEFSYWQSMDRCGDTGCYQAYLDKYPNGQFIGAARAQLTKLSGADKLLSFTVKTTPYDARVRILNIKPKYYDEIKLKPGSYKIEVSKSGYTPQVTQFYLYTNSQVFEVELKKKKKSNIVTLNRNRKHTFKNPTIDINYLNKLREQTVDKKIVDWIDIIKAGVLSRKGDVKTALAIVNKVKAIKMRDIGYGLMTKELAANQNIELAKVVARKINEPVLKALAFTSIKNTKSKELASGYIQPTTSMIIGLFNFIASAYPSESYDGILHLIEAVESDELKLMAYAGAIIYSTAPKIVGKYLSTLNNDSNPVIRHLANTIRNDQTILDDEDNLDLNLLKSLEYLPSGFQRNSLAFILSLNAIDKNEEGYLEWFENLEDVELKNVVKFSFTLKPGDIKHYNDPTLIEPIAYLKENNEDNQFFTKFVNSYVNRFSDKEHKGLKEAFSMLGGGINNEALRYVTSPVISKFIDIYLLDKNKEKIKTDSSKLKKIIDDMNFFDGLSGNGNIARKNGLFDLDRVLNNINSNHLKDALNILKINEDFGDGSHLTLSQDPAKSYDPALISPYEIFVKSMDSGAILNGKIYLEERLEGTEKSFSFLKNPILNINLDFRQSVDMGNGDTYLYSAKTGEYCDGPNNQIEWGFKGDNGFTLFGSYNLIRSVDFQLFTGACSGFSKTNLLDTPLRNHHGLLYVNDIEDKRLVLNIPMNNKEIRSWTLFADYEDPSASRGELTARIGNMILPDNNDYVIKSILSSSEWDLEGNKFTSTVFKQGSVNELKPNNYFLKPEDIQDKKDIQVSQLQLNAESNNYYIIIVTIHEKGVETKKINSLIITQHISKGAMYYSGLKEIIKIDSNGKESDVDTKYVNGFKYNSRKLFR